MLIQETGILPMVLSLSQQQNTTVRNTSDPTNQIMAITTETPSKPNMVNGFGGSGSGGGVGQLASQSTQLQAGTAGWRNKTNFQQKESSWRLTMDTEQLEQITAPLV